jgi:hypothetical protein
VPADAIYEINETSGIRQLMTLSPPAGPANHSGD